MKRLLLAGICLSTWSCVHPTDEGLGTPGNRPPVIQSLTATPSTINVGASATVEVVASDPENQPLSYKWSASTGDIFGEGPSVRFSASFCCRGPNYVQVTVKDNAGGSVTERVDVFINY